MDIVVRTDHLSYDEFRLFVVSSSNWFTPSLEEMSNLDDWILKMYENGLMYYLVSDSKIVALVVTYHNAALKYIYIPYVCVSPNLQNQGIAKHIISYIAKKMPINTHDIYLEVRKDNESGIQLYRKLGFYNSEDRGQKYLMKKEVY